MVNPFSLSNQAALNFIVRDQWENKKPDLEAQLLEKLGTAWTFDINPNAVYAYAESNSFAQESLGTCIFGYLSTTPTLFFLN
jgi:hypothetical protein